MAYSDVIAVANCSAYIQGGVSYEVTTSSSGITVNVRFYMRRTNTYSGTTSSTSVTQYITISGDPSLYNYSETDAIYVYGGQQNVWQGPYFTASRTFDASRGGGTIYIGWKTVENVVSGYLAGNGYTPITLPTVTSAPTGLAVSNLSPGPESLTATVSITGWGVGGTTSARYKELEIYTYSSSGLTTPRRFATVVSSDLSSSITVNNSGQDSLTIVPNTRYVYGAYANNGAAHVGPTRMGTFYTLPQAPSVSNLSVSTDTALFSYGFSSNGGALTVFIEYSLDLSTWTAADSVTTSGSKSGTFTVSGLSPNTSYTLYTRARTSAGNTVGNTVTFTTSKPPAKFYGSVSGKTDLVTKMFGSVDGKSDGILNFYGSVDGKTKKIGTWNWREYSSDGHGTGEPEVVPVEPPIGPDPE